MLLRTAGGGDAEVEGALFERVLNHKEPPNPPEVEPGDELNIRTDRITHG